MQVEIPDCTIDGKKWKYVGYGLPKKGQALLYPPSAVSPLRWVRWILDAQSDLQGHLCEEVKEPRYIKPLDLLGKAVIDPATRKHHVVTTANESYVYMGGMVTVEALHKSGWVLSDGSSLKLE